MCGAAGDVNAGLVYYMQPLSSIVALNGHDKGRPVHFVSSPWLLFAWISHTLRASNKV